MLPCGCVSHTTGFQIVVGDWRAKKECVAAQAEIERKAAAYDALLEAAKLALKRHCGCMSNVDTDWHSKDCAVPLLRAAIKAAELVKEP